MTEYKTRTIESYDRNARTFAEKFKALCDLKRRYEFQRFIDLLTGNRVLDLGCGAGDHAQYFTQQGFSVTCVDLSASMIALCRQKCLDARVMDIENLQFPEASFDGVWSVTSLLHIPKFKLPDVLRGIDKILRPRGIFYICMKQGDGEGFVDDGEGLQRYFAFWHYEELTPVIERQFDSLEFRTTPFGKNVFLEYFLRKKEG